MLSLLALIQLSSADMKSHNCTQNTRTGEHTCNMHALNGEPSASHTVISEDLCRFAKKGSNQCLSLRNRTPTHPPFSFLFNTFLRSARARSTINN